MLKIACVGDSITYGSGVRGRKDNCYPARLGTLLGSNFTVGNFGAPGACATIQSNDPFVGRRKFNKSIRFQPDLVILAFGSNDSKKANWNKTRFTEDYEWLVNFYLNLPSRPLVVLVQPVTAFSKLFGIQKSVIDNEVWNIIGQLGKNLSLPVIDLNTLSQGKKSLMTFDGVHPNAKGAEFISERIFSQIKNIVVNQPESFFIDRFEYQGFKLNFSSISRFISNTIRPNNKLLVEFEHGKDNF